MKSDTTAQSLRSYIQIALAWALFWFAANLLHDPNTFIERVPNEIWRILYLLPLNFGFFEYAWPHATRKRDRAVTRIVVTAVVVLLVIVLCSYGLYFWRQFGIRLHIYAELNTFNTVVEAVIYQASGALLSFVLFGSVKHVKTYNQLRLTAQSLRMEKQQAELIYLKSRTNPHFLFNTLNSIFALARNKSDLTPESILRLSSILRFMLYETQAAFVAIEKEIKIISDYIALERLRYDETFRASFTYDIEDVNQLVPPLLLLPLVENAFKHGVSETEELPFLNIHLSLNQNELIFLVSNSTESAAREGPQMENIGLSTLRRRLELLFKDYSLSLKQGNAEFIATLKINLRESDKDDMYHH